MFCSWFESNWVCISTAEGKTELSKNKTATVKVWQSINREETQHISGFQTSGSHWFDLQRMQSENYNQLLSEEIGFILGNIFMKKNIMKIKMWNNLLANVLNPHTVVLSRSSFCCNNSFSLFWHMYIPALHLVLECIFAHCAWQICSRFFRLVGWCLCTVIFTWCQCQWDKDQELGHCRAFTVPFWTCILDYCPAKVIVLQKLIF